MKLFFLGTGTSSGIPIIGCSCKVCLSRDSRDKRFRCSMLLTYNNKNILIDAGPDIRQQFLKFRIQYINSILITHSHYDHITGLDELRPFTIHNNINLFAEKHTMNDVKRVFPYIFDQTNIQLGGGITQFNDQIIDLEPFQIDDLTIEPIRILHGRLPIVGYKIGKVAYLTDVKTLPQESLQQLQGIEILILSCLRLKQHPTHLNLDEAIKYINIINPKKTFFIHMDHSLSHAEWKKHLPENVYVAYDGLEIDISK